MLLFGGESCDGESTTVFNELFRWNIERNEWKLIESLNTPPPRCSHQAVVFKDNMFIFGGEYATLDQFHHYRDMWTLDLKTNVWREINCNTGDAPSARCVARCRNNTSNCTHHCFVSLSPLYVTSLFVDTCDPAIVVLSANCFVLDVSPIHPSGLDIAWWCGEATSCCLGGSTRLSKKCGGSETSSCFPSRMSDGCPFQVHQTYHPLCHDLTPLPNRSMILPIVLTLSLLYYAVMGITPSSGLSMCSQTVCPCA
jgi:hypothetical protein